MGRRRDEDEQRTLGHGACGWVAELEERGTPVPRRISESVPRAISEEVFRASPTLPPVLDGEGPTLSGVVSFVSVLLLTAGMVAWFTAPLIG